MLRMLSMRLIVCMQHTRSLVRPELRASGGMFSSSPGPLSGTGDLMTLAAPMLPVRLSICEYF